MADDKTTKTPEQPVTDSGPGKETPPAPPKEPEKVSVSPEPEKKTEPEVKNPQVSVYTQRYLYTFYSTDFLRLVTGTSASNGAKKMFFQNNSAFFAQSTP